MQLAKIFSAYIVNANVIRLTSSVFKPDFPSLVGSSLPLDLVA